MKIFPAIDLHNGRAVRLYKGDYNQVTDYGNPLDMAKKWKSLGASFLHLVDLDGAKEGSSLNLHAVKEIIDNVDIKLELGGGIRTIEKIEELLNLGLDRVIIGSKALDLEFVKEAINRFGSDRIVIGLDSRNMMISTHGWLDMTDINAYDFALKLKEIGVKNIIFTDISKDGTLEGINKEQTAKMVSSGVTIIASGGAKSINDIKIAKEIGCGGIILGKSIYNGDIDLEEAIKKFED